MSRTESPGRLRRSATCRVDHRRWPTNVHLHPFSSTRFPQLDIVRCLYNAVFASIKARTITPGSFVVLKMTVDLAKSHKERFYARSSASAWSTPGCYESERVFSFPPYWFVCVCQGTCKLPLFRPQAPSAFNNNNIKTSLSRMIASSSSNLMIQLMQIPIIWYDCLMLPILHRCNAVDYVQLKATPSAFQHLGIAEESQFYLLIIIIMRKCDFCVKISTCSLPSVHSTLA